MESKRSNQSLNTDYDIMIVGGGPAGISTWLHLQKHAQELSERSLLIEKVVYPREKVCGGALASLGKDVLKQLEINVNIPSVPIHNLEYRFGKEIFCYKQPNFLQIIRRIEFDHMLAKAAMARGIQLNEDEMLIDIAHIENGLEVKTNKGKYTVKVLVGADGAFSLVRKKMKLSVKPHFAPAIEVITSVDPQYDPEFASNTAVFDFTALTEGLQGYVWHFPCIKDGKPSMNHGICDTHMNTKKPRANLKKIFSHELQLRKINYPSSCWLGYPVPWFSEEPHLSKPNILLVGDAAGIEPFIGGGIHLSLLYGEVASFAIKDAFIKNDFSFKDYDARVQNHIVGKYIRKFTHFAYEVYNDKMSLFDALQKIIKK